jgi:hypothetical protein
MAGDDRVRHCSFCSLNVYNFAEMTRDEVRELLERADGRICGRLYQRADGTLMTKDCPSRLSAARQRVTRLAASFIAAFLSVSAFAADGSACRKPRLRRHGSKMKLNVEHVLTQQQVVFTGVVADVDANPLPGVTVLIRDETTQRELTAITDANGAFTIASLSDGSYRVEVTLSGFKPAVVEHLPLESHDVAHARVTLRLDPAMMVTVGIIAVDSLGNTGNSTTFTKDFIDKLPIQ